MCKGNYDQTIETPNPLRPSNKVTILPDAVEQMTELQFAEYERNDYQKKYLAASFKLTALKSIVESMSDDIGWKSILLKTIG